jgi:hypothetical protein
MFLIFAHTGIEVSKKNEKDPIQKPIQIYIQSAFPSFKRHLCLYGQNTGHRKNENKL